MLGFWADAVVALLLIATIGYSVVLNRRLTAVRSDREKFEVLIRNLNTASKRAEDAVANLRATADDLGRHLDKKVEEARGLSDDLAYMIERGSNIADKLVGQIRAGLDGLKPDLKSEPKTEVRAAVRPEHKVEPVARRAMRAETARPSVSANEAFRAEQRAAVFAGEMIENVLKSEPTGATSRAERDLLRALSRRR